MTIVPRLLSLGGRGRISFAFAILFGTLTVATGAGLLITSAYLISQAALHPPVLALLVAIVFVRAFAIARALLRYTERLISHDAGLRILAEIRTWFYERLEPIAPAGLAAFRSGDLLARMVADVEGLQDFYIRSLAPPLVAVLTLGILVGFGWLLLPSAALVLGAGMILGGLLLPVVVRSLGRGIGRSLTDAQGELSAESVELLLGAADIAAFGCQASRLARIRAIDRRLRRLEGVQAMIAGLGSGLGLLLAGLTVVAILWLAIPAVRTGVLDGVLLGVLGLLPMAAVEAIAPLPAAYQELEKQLEAGRRILAVADSHPLTTPLSGATRVPRSGPLAMVGGRLRYQAEGAWALDGVDIGLEPGGRVALVGASGAGKSSVANVLVRFRDLDSGCVTLCGQDLRDFKPDDVRRIVGLVSQDVHLFNTSILENIRLARPDAPLAEIEEVANRARLFPWLRTLNRGWDTVVGERGEQVSGGQRQRIALARAILAKFPILILDEPTAHLDSLNAQALMADFVAATGPATLLVITHRLYEMHRMHEIVVLEQGRVVGRGSHRQLLATNRTYRDLWRSQTQSPRC